MQKEVTGVPLLVCINKSDVASQEHLDNIVEETRGTFANEEILEISAKTGMNVPNLLRRVVARLNAPLSN